MARQAPKTSANPVFLSKVVPKRRGAFMLSMVYVVLEVKEFMQLCNSSLSCTFKKKVHMKPKNHSIESTMNVPKIFGLAALLLIMAVSASASSAGRVAANAGASDPVAADAVLKSVTVFRQGAELTHAVSVSLPAGNTELDIDRVSNAIDLNSVQIHLPSTVTLLGFTYMSDYLTLRPKTPRQQQLEDSLNRLTDNREKLQLAMTNNDDLLNVLKKNQELKGSQTGMNVADLQKLMDYYQRESGDLTATQFQLKKRLAHLDEDIERMKEQINEEETKNARESGRLVLRLSVLLAGNVDFALSYITANAGWTPTYELQVKDVEGSVKVVYKANIHQATGLNWQQVKMALSTSLPGNWNQAPALDPWFVNVEKSLSGSVAGVEVAPESDEVVMAYGSQRMEDRKTFNIRGSASPQNALAPLYVVDGQVWTEDAFKKINASAVASMKVLKGAGATALYGSQAAGGVMLITLKKDLADYTGVDEQRLNTVYTIDLPYDLPSTGNDQTVALQTSDVKALFKYLAVPKISDDVYLLADIPNWGKLNLLPGKANILLNGTYVGLATIDPTSTQDTLHLTVGKDKRITIQRLKVVDFSSEKFLNANHFQKYTYEIDVRNNKKDSISLSVLDQIPVSSNKDVEVTLNETGNASVDADKGELKWTIVLRSGESGKVQFGYTLKYPKDERVTMR
jgi:TonB-dependent SusC/RagA subfamily outer membrane receptor